MRFEHEWLFWSLPAVAVAVSCFFWWSWRKRQRLIAYFVRSRLLAHLTVGVSTARQRLRMALVGAAIVLVWFVLARPQWGYTWEEARQRGLDILVAIDTSRSMLAEDLAPSRLARAKLAALDLKRLASADRVGLVAFAGSAFLQCPLSFDDEAFRQNVNALDTSIIPQGGTALAEAIQCALAAFKGKSDNHKILVLFTDGEDHDGKAKDGAREAAEAGLRIFTVGVGTPNGELLRVADAKGRTDYIRDEQGNVVKSRLNEALLREVAEAGGGFYLLLTGANTMELLYERGLAPLPKSEFTARRIRRYHERYQWFLGLAISLLAIEILLPERKRVPRSEAILQASNAELRKAVALLLACLLLPGTLAASPAKAWKEYKAGRYGTAAREYERSLEKKPNDPRLKYNGAAAAYRKGDYETALDWLNGALMSEDLHLQQNAYYNRGNTQFRLGEQESELEQRRKLWEQALTSYENALQLNPTDVDAKYNRDLVKRKIELLEEQQKQQQKKEEKDQNQENKEQKNQDQQGQGKQDEQREQQQKDEQQKKEQEQKPGEQEKEKPDQQPGEQQNQQEEKSGEKKPGENQSGQQKKAEEGSENPQGAQPMGTMQMTPQQAQQLLDSLKAEERAMIFIPQVRTNRNERRVRDW